MQPAAIDYWAGIDGGGSRTRALLADAGGRVLGRGESGPSGLSQGLEQAWAAVGSALERASAAAGLARLNESRLGVGIGVAGAAHPDWGPAFRAAAPVFGRLAIDTDAFTMLLGAHGGAPGLVVAVGTGSVALAWEGPGLRRLAGGWGYPTGDEGSGAWMGQRAVAHLQQVLDGRAPPGPLSEALAPLCGRDRQALSRWLAAAGQAPMATLAPCVLTTATRDTAARRIAEQAGQHLQALAEALDPSARLPWSLCGGLAEPLRPYLPAAFARRAAAPLADGATGALLLVRSSVVCG